VFDDLYFIDLVAVDLLLCNLDLLYRLFFFLPALILIVSVLDIGLEEHLQNDLFRGYSIRRIWIWIW